MSLFVLDAFIWILGIRGHIPQSGGYGPAPGQSSLGTNSGILIRALAAFVLMIGFFSLPLWAAVWLTLKLL